MSELMAFGPQLVELALVVIASLVAALVLVGRRPWVFGLVPWASALAVGSALSIAVATLTRLAPNGAWVARGRVQPDPFATIRGYQGDVSALAFYVAGNVLLFVPLGFFLYLALRRGVLLPAVLTVAASATVETLQLGIYSRNTDVDDLLLNSLGGIGGVLAAAVVLALWQRLRTALPQPDRHPQPPRRDRPLASVPASGASRDDGLGGWWGPVRSAQGVGDRAS
jgi:hypothetical protein